MLFAYMSALALATATVPAPKPSATPPAPASLVDAVAARMTPAGRSTFTTFMRQTFAPRVRAEAQAEVTYRQQLATLVGASTLDVDAVQKLIDARKQAEAASTAAIRSASFAMIRTLPAADRKLALTAIFVEARPLRPRPAATTPAAKPN